MTYTVQPGDTGEKIAAKYTGDKNRWRELLTVNPALKDPTYGIRLYAGRAINLPDAWAPSAPTPTTAIEEKKGLSTGAMVGLAAGGALVVGGIIYAATRAPRRKGGKARRRARK
jgi:hypothetical protein